MRREMSRRAHTHIERRDLSTSLPEKMMSELLVSHERDPTLPFQACHAATAVTELQLAVACRMVGAPKARTHVHTRMRRTFKTLVTNEQSARGNRLAKKCAMTWYEAAGKSETHNT